MTPPEQGDVLRRLDELRGDIQTLGLRLEANYVRKDVQDAREMGTALQIQGLEQDYHHLGKRLDKIEERLTAHFRLLLGSLIYPLIVGLIVYVILGAVHR